MLSREAILEAQDLKTETVEIPEWGGAVLVRGLTVGEVSRIVNMATPKGGTLNVLNSAVWTFIAGVVDPKFTEEDFDALKKKSAAILRAVKVINRLSGINEDADSVADAEKN